MADFVGKKTRPRKDMILECPVCSTLMYPSIHQVLKKIKAPIFIYSSIETIIDKMAPGHLPCASYKLLRRLCATDCIFAPNLPSDNPHNFAVVGRQPKLEKHVEGTADATTTDTQGNQKLLHPFHVGIEGFVVTVASVADYRCILQPSYGQAWKCIVDGCSRKMEGEIQRNTRLGMWKTRRAGISAKKEASVNFLTDPSNRRSTLRPADTALKVVSCKVTKHEKACIENQHVFIPFAFDTFCFLAPEAVELLSRVQPVMHSNVMTPRSTDVARVYVREQPCNDVFVHCCCEFCALCQEYRELKNRGFEPSLGWEGNFMMQEVVMPPVGPGEMKQKDATEGRCPTCHAHYDKDRIV
nr:auxilin-like protein [Tanacetum cinerariifolium]